MSKKKKNKIPRDENGHFLPGKGGGPGRPKGSKSKRIKMWEEMGEWIVNEGVEKYLTYLKSMDPERYMDHFEAVLEYFKPKLSRTNVKNEGGQKITIEHREIKNEDIKEDE